MQVEANEVVEQTDHLIGYMVSGLGFVDLDTAQDAGRMEGKAHQSDGAVVPWVNDWYLIADHRWNNSNDAGYCRRGGFGVTGADLPTLGEDP